MTDKDIELWESKKTADGNENKVSEDDQLICNFEVAGFALGEKRWCWFLVDQIHDIEFDDSAFANLLLPQAQTRLVRALTRQHTALGKQGDTFDDVISGKGKGSIFLLHGPPGVGKTATVESVSDELRRPLYVMMSGELGSAVETVERNLQRVLRLVTKWRAVLLIDEADVFLEARAANDLARNSLVSIFLRLLEYFKGIMFLTTNRADTLDQAFQSRIHLTLAYKPLERSARANLWRFFLKRADEAAASAVKDATGANGHVAGTGGKGNRDWPEGCIEDFAAITLNGRQIKNAVRTAHTLALSENRTLSPDDVQVVLDTISEFEKDFQARPLAPNGHIVPVSNTHPGLSLDSIGQRT
jgi:SpoVK/Ycf46/Vps4 family AAA+-type ATPase